MLTKEEWTNLISFANDSRLIQRAIAHIREQDEQLAKRDARIKFLEDFRDAKNEVIVKRDKTIADLQETHRFLNDRVHEQEAECRERMSRAGTTILALDDHVRVLEAGVAEAWEIIAKCEVADLRRLGLLDNARKWFAAHPAPKETK